MAFIAKSFILLALFVAAATAARVPTALNDEPVPPRAAPDDEPMAPQTEPDDEAMVPQTTQDDEPMTPQTEPDDEPMLPRAAQDGEPMPSQDADAVVAYLDLLAKCFAEKVVGVVPGCADELGGSFLRGKIQLSEACLKAVSSLPDECPEPILDTAIPPAMV